MNFFKWLFGIDDEVPTEKVEIKETVKTKVEEKMDEVKAEKKGGFIDSETGKVYKSERSMKAAITRRKNASKKKKGKSKR